MPILSLNNRYPTIRLPIIIGCEAGKKVQIDDNALSKDD
jgi:hypothetical protein